MSHSVSNGRGASADKRQRPHRAFGDLTVGFKEAVVAAACQGHHRAVARDLQTDCDRMAKRICPEVVCLHAPDAFRRAAERLHHGHAAGPEPGLGQEPGKPAHGGSVAQEHDGAGARRQMRAQPLHRRGVQPQAQRPLQRPAQPGGRQRKGRGRGQGGPFARIKAPCDDRARAEPERIARGQHHHAPSAQTLRGSAARQRKARARAGPLPSAVAGARDVGAGPSRPPRPRARGGLRATGHPGHLRPDRQWSAILPEPHPWRPTS